MVNTEKVQTGSVTTGAVEWPTSAEAAQPVAWQDNTGTELHKIILDYQKQDMILSGGRQAERAPNYSIPLYRALPLQGELQNMFPRPDRPDEFWHLRQRFPLSTELVVEQDGFLGTVQGYYITREGHTGLVLQDKSNRVVHVYKEKWFNV